MCSGDCVSCETFALVLLLAFTFSPFVCLVILLIHFLCSFYILTLHRLRHSTVDVLEIPLVVLFSFASCLRKFTIHEACIQYSGSKSSEPKSDSTHMVRCSRKQISSRRNYSNPIDLLQFKSNLRCCRS